MIRKLLRAAFSLFSLFATLYFVFFVPLGRYTLWEHLWRISRTEEAQDLGREAGEAAVRATETVKEEVERVLHERRAQDGGATGDDQAASAR